MAAYIGVPLQRMPSTLSSMTARICAIAPFLERKAALLRLLRDTEAGHLGPLNTLRRTALPCLSTLGRLGAAPLRPALFKCEASQTEPPAAPA
jgi:hypothetical protein